MKTIILLAFVGLTIAAPIAEPEPASTPVPVVQILRSNTDIGADGSYTYSFETEDGYSREETGTVINPGEENAYVSVVGSYKYTDLDGQVFQVRYTSNTGGFVPFGSHIPEEISNNAKALSEAPAEPAEPAATVAPVV